MKPTPLEVDIALVERVRNVVATTARRTPLRRSDWLSGLTGGEVFLKCENLQVTGSFKVRGALAALSLLPGDVRARGVVASSAGNHGLGLARAAQVFGVPVVVVVPRSVPEVKAHGIEALGGEVVVSPHKGYDDTQTWTLEHLEELGGTFISPFEDAGVIAGGGGSLGLEIFEEAGDLEAVVAPCGGGGLGIGLGVAARARSPGTRIVGVNTDASPGMWMSRRDGRPHLKVESRPTIAEGIEGGVGALSFPLAETYIDEVLKVPEAAVRRSVREVLDREGMVIEGSAAAAVAAVVEGRVRAKRMCVVLTGSNIDPERLRALVAREGP